MRVTTGLENFLACPPRWAGKARLGLLCNQASVDSRFRHVRRLFARKFGRRFAVLFSPQHGPWGEKQDNMVESPHGRDPKLGITAFSLYSGIRRPTAEMLKGIDILVVDLQEVGCRVYTFLTTLYYCLEAAARHGKKVVVLDRPNPVGGEIEGNILEAEMISFVGAFPLPMRHGMTIGELALLFSQGGNIGGEVEVIPLRGWRRKMLFPETGLPWVSPSPNMPSPDTALVYPGQVLLEGTNLSEGRGTTLPFELCGAPFIEPEALSAALSRYRLPGMVLRETFFQPTHQKWSGKVCGGLQIHLTKRLVYRPYRTTLTILHEVIRLWPDKFSWRRPPYEYERRRLPFDILCGNPRIRKRLERGDRPSEIEDTWRVCLDSFRQLAENFYLYR